MIKKNIISLLIVNSYLFCQTLFFSEYAEGSSNNKYLEIYNPTNQAINLTDYAYPSTANAPDTPGVYEFWNEFDSGASINPGDVYVICHPSLDGSVSSECDETHTYLSNGNDGYCLVLGSEGNYSLVDCIGDWDADPGNGWDVAGVSEATKDHTLVRTIDVNQGNSGDWNSSAGTNSENSEWIVLERDDWSYLGSHPHDIVGGGTDGGSDGGNSDSEVCNDGIDNDGDGYIDCDDFDCGFNDGCGGEICDDGIDNDDDGYVDCDDFDCSSDSACENASGGSCAEYGCVDYTPSNACQCNDLCTQFGNCCDDYEELCAGGTDGGSDGGSGSEICNDGIDNDGDGYVDCEDYNCDGTIGDADPACGGSGSGGGSDSEICDDGIDNDGDGYVDCDDYNCDGTIGDADPACSGSGTDTGGTGGTDPVDAALIFFSEYAEGSSNNKYLEIYNADNTSVDLGMYSISTCANGCNDGSSWDYPNNVEFSTGTILNPGEVYVVCNGSADGTILAECDQYFTYLSNGDDVMGLTQLSTGGIVDIIGEIGDDPGNGWDVAGVNDATKDHTLVRKSNITSGNSDWTLSAGTNSDNSEWIVYDQNTWDYLGYHESGPVSGCLDESAYNFNPDAEIEDNSSCIYTAAVTIQEIQGQIDSSPYENLPVSTQGVVTAVNANGFYMQNGGGAWSGIWIYNNDANLSIEVGQLVTVVGIVLEFYGLTEIEADTVEVISANNQVDVTEVSTNELNDESYESVIVQVFNATCTALPNQYDDWIINDGSGNLLVGDDFISFNPDLNMVYNITGVIDYEFSEFKIQALDVSIAYEEGAPVAQAGDDQFVDEGTLVTLDAVASYDDNGSIFGYEWIQTSGIPVDLGNYESQIVQFIAPNQFTVLEFSLVVMDNDFNFSYPDYVKITVGSQGIYDVQFTENVGASENDCYPSDFLAQSINITGVVTTVKSFSSYPHFFIQDPNVSEWAGVYVYVGESEPFNVGDELNFTAEVEEYYGVTELKNLTNVELLSQNNVIDPIAISTGDLGLTCGTGEKYEGMLVNFSNVVVESIDAQYNSVYVNDGSGTAKFDDYFFNFDAGFWPDLNVGDTLESVSGVVHYYFGEYVIYPRDLNDMTPGDGGGTGGGDPVVTSIYDIQYSNNAGSADEDCYPSSLSGQNVSVTGVVSLVKDFSSYPNFFIQDNTSSDWGGVYVYVQESDALSVGDEVSFTAEVDEYFGVTELKNVSNLQLLSSSNDVNSVTISSGELGLNCGDGEKYEGMMIDLSNLTVESIDSQYGSVYVNDGSGTAKIDDYFFNFDQGEWPDLSVGDTINSVMGVVHYYYGEYVIYPGDLSYFSFDDSTSCTIGDINQDNTVNVVDIVQAVNYVLGMITFNEAQMCASDLNGDQIVNVIDIVQLVNVILGVGL